MKERIVDMLIENLIKALDIPEETSETPKTSETTTRPYLDEVSDLISHPGFQEFMDGDIEDPMLVSTFIEGATPCLQIFDIASDEQLQYLTPELKEKIIPYLEKLKATYAKAVDNIIARITAPVSERSLEDLSKEELLDYIKSHLQ